MYNVFLFLNKFLMKLVDVFCRCMFDNVVLFSVRNIVGVVLKDVIRF